MPAPLITLNEYKSIAGLDATDTRDDAKINALIGSASNIVRNYTERDFGSTVVTEPREFEYDGSGFLDIDDATSVTELRFVVPNSSDIVVDTDGWYAAPHRRDDAPVYYYLVVGPVAGISPEMGFNRNLDVLYAEGRFPSVTRIARVTGTWGWPAVPDDVKLAVAWVLQDWTSKPSNDQLTSEMIAGFSRSWGGKNPLTGGSAAMAVPNKVRDILAHYQKIYV